VGVVRPAVYRTGVATYRPLSRRGDPSFDVLVHGVPGHLVEPLAQWFRWVANTEGGHIDAAKLQALQNKLRLERPFRWSGGIAYTWADLKSRIGSDKSFGLDAADAFLRMGYVSEPLRRYLRMLLRDAGSIWEVTDTDGGRARLTERAPGPVIDAIGAVGDASDRAYRHLRDSWVALMGRQPDSSTAYREAVRAVEAAAKPVVSPANELTTLGTIIRDMRAKPDKWAVGLEHGTPEQVIAMCDLLWKGQVDRHGSDDPDAPLNVTQEEADSAFYLALALVRLFTSGAVARR
jgi:hypothetical protein